MLSPAYDSFPNDQKRMDVWFLKVSKLFFARSSTASLHCGKDPGTLHDGSIAPSFWNEPWLSRFLPSHKYLHCRTYSTMVSDQDSGRYAQN